MRAYVCVLLALFSVASAPVLRADVSAVPPPPVSSSVSFDSALARLRGAWRSNADPEIVMIGINPAGSLWIDAGRRFEAVGFLVGDEFVGVTQAPTRRAAQGKPTQLGTLKFHRVGENEIEASFEGPPGTTPRRETWTIAQEYRGTTKPVVVVPPGTAPSPDSPKFGDYVYVEELPEALTKVAPSYPEEVRKLGVDGTVLVQALVGEDGLVKDAKVTKSIPGLDDAAVAAVRQWRFKPAMAKGQPVAVWVAVPMKFTLHKP